MAGEEDVELRDLVAQTLETKGVLGKIRAQLRASVFLALEEQESQQRPHPLVSSKLEQFQKSKEGKLVTALVREFLEFFELEYTCSVFDPETNALEAYPGRDRLAKDLNLDPQATPAGPLLAHLVHHTLSPASRQLKFTDTSSVSRTATTETPHVTTVSDVGRGSSSAGGATSLYPQTTPTLHPAPPGTGIGTRSENESERISQTFLQNDKHFKQQMVGLNSNENSNSEGAQEPRMTSSQAKHDGSGLHLDERLGIGLGSLQSTNVYAELGESFANSADSSLDVDKLINTSVESERLGDRLKQSPGGGDPSRDELNDFFENTAMSAPMDSKREGQSRDSVLGDVKGKSGELGETNKFPYADDFHSDDPSSHASEHQDDLPETEDQTFSQSSLGGTVDYIEPVFS